ncbi:MAG: HAD family phosphatase [Lachnospiraceae bacterium]|nr:HAD family phosphatase [Lachnospiraceae bacterium]
MITGVVFDMDGVIFDSESKVRECWKDIADRYGILDIGKATGKCLGCNAKIVKAIFLEQYGEQFDYDFYSRQVDSLFEQRYGEGRLPLKPGIGELLAFLKDNQVKTAVASSTNREIVVRELSDAGLLHWFDAVIGGDMVKESKPKPDIFLKACEEIGVRPEQTYIIEDSYNGIRAAFHAGAMPVMVPDLLPPTEEMREKAVKILPSLMDVKVWMEGKNE